VAGLSKDLFMRFSASLSRLEGSQFVAGFTPAPSAFEFTWDVRGFSSFTVHAEKVEPWVSFVARDARLALSPFIPEDTPCAMGLSLPIDADRTLVAKALLTMLYPIERHEPVWREFGETLGLTPDKLGMLTRSRFYLYFLPGMELEPENAVYAIDLPRNVTPEDIVNEMRNGQVFGGKPPLNMLEGGRKLFVADTGAEQLGFTVASLNNYLLFSGSHQAVKGSIEAFSSSKGLTARCNPEVAAAICADATAIVRLNADAWTRAFPFVIPVADRRDVTAGFKFSSTSARVDADFMPTMWLPLTLLSITQRREMP
jgi:hypothetical protein